MVRVQVERIGGESSSVHLNGTLVGYVTRVDVWGNIHYEAETADHAHVGRYTGRGARNKAVSGLLARVS